MDKLTRVAGLLCTGLLAGGFCYTVFTVVPTFYQVPREVHLMYRVPPMRRNALYLQIIYGPEHSDPGLGGHSRFGI
jgi:hypothetical protein